MVDEYTVLISVCTLQWLQDIPIQCLTTLWWVSHIYFTFCVGSSKHKQNTFSDNRLKVDVMTLLRRLKYLGHHILNLLWNLVLYWGICYKGFQIMPYYQILLSNSWHNCFCILCCFQYSLLHILRPWKTSVIAAGILGWDLSLGHPCFKFSMSCVHISAPNISYLGVIQGLPEFLPHKCQDNTTN